MNNLNLYWRNTVVQINRKIEDKKTVKNGGGKGFIKSEGGTKKNKTSVQFIETHSAEF